MRGVTDVPLQVDVNEAWSLEQALEALPQLAELGVQYCEQPLPAGDPDGPELKRRSPLPIYVDEDCHTLDDVAFCAERAHGLTVKLAKSGGIREAVRMAHAGRALGLGLMLGCMNESGLAVAAGAACASLFDHVDLDGNLLLVEDPWPGVELVDGVQLPVPRRSPGSGVAQKRYLILAEGRSGDPHYGKTARGILRYAPDPTVAILDSTRAGESYEGVPVVATVEEGLQHGRRPPSSASPPRAAASRPPGASC